MKSNMKMGKYNRKVGWLGVMWKQKSLKMVELNFIMNER